MYYTIVMLCYENAIKHLAISLSRLVVLYHYALDFLFKVGFFTTKHTPKFNLVWARLNRNNRVNGDAFYVGCHGTRRDNVGIEGILLYC